MCEIGGKKLLILGGSALACDIVETAKEMGVQTYVANYDEDSPAKSKADKSFCISTTDVEGLVSLCREQAVDGAFTASDLSFPFAQKVCEFMNFPFTTNSDQLEKISNKKEAKKLCLEHGIRVPKEYNLTDDFLQKDLQEIEYPVLVKPVDNYGQEGISICRNPDEVKAGYLKAVSSSKSRQIVIEDYINGDYVVLCFTIQNGFISMSAMADKPVLEESKSNGLVRLPKAYCLSSRYLELFKVQLLEKFISLIRNAKIWNGSFSAEAVVSNNKFYVFEMQTRLGGMKHHEFVKYENNIDILSMHIRFALTGQFAGWSIKENDNPGFVKKHCMLHLILGPGKINSITGLEEIKEIPEVMKVYALYKENDTIELSGTLKQIFAKILIVSATCERLAKVIDKINTTVNVLDVDGRSLLIDGLTSGEYLQLNNY